jgi:hypothetical protein
MVFAHAGGTDTTKRQVGRKRMQHHAIDLGVARLNLADNVFSLCRHVQIVRSDAGLAAVDEKSLDTVHSDKH